MALIDSIIGAESGGDPNARNPNSSATGAGQFIASTWLDTIGRARPDLVQGKTNEEILALRNDPVLSREMTDFYANQNSAHLAKNGLPVTGGNTYLAHFAGAGGAVKVLQADPNAPVSSVLDPSAMKANPFLANMTAGDLRAWADRKMGGAQPAPQAAPAPPNGLLAQAPAPLNLMPQQQAPPIFAPQAATGDNSRQLATSQPSAPFEAPMQMAPIFTPPRKQIDLSKLRAAFQAPTFSRG